MGIRVLKEASNSRTAGYKVNVVKGVPEAILPGLACNLVDAETITIADGTTELTIGLALDSNVLYPITNSIPDGQAGQGYDYLNYNRQGLVALFSNGEVELYDDMRLPAGASHPANFVAPAGAWVINSPVYVDNVGKATAVGTPGATPVIGVVTGITNPGVASLVLRIKLSI